MVIIFIPADALYASFPLLIHSSPWNPIGIRIPKGIIFPGRMLYISSRKRFSRNYELLFSYVILIFQGKYII